MPSSAQAGRAAATGRSGACRWDALRRQNIRAIGPCAACARLAAPSRPPEMICAASDPQPQPRRAAAHRGARNEGRGSAPRQAWRSSSTPRRGRWRFRPRGCRGWLPRGVERPGRSFLRLHRDGGHHPAYEVVAASHAIAPWAGRRRLIAEDRLHDGNAPLGRGERGAPRTSRGPAPRPASPGRPRSSAPEEGQGAVEVAARVKERFARFTTSRSMWGRLTESPIGQRPVAAARRSKAVPTTVTAPARRQCGQEVSETGAQPPPPGLPPDSGEERHSLSKKSRSRSSGASANASDTPASAMKLRSATGPPPRSLRMWVLGSARGACPRRAVERGVRRGAGGPARRPCRRRGWRTGGPSIPSPRTICAAAPGPPPPRLRASSGSCAGDLAAISVTGRPARASSRCAAPRPRTSPPSPGARTGRVERAWPSPAHLMEHVQHAAAGARIRMATFAGASSGGAGPAPVTRESSSSERRGRSPFLPSAAWYRAPPRPRQPRRGQRANMKPSISSGDSQVILRPKRATRAPWRFACESSSKVSRVVPAAPPRMPTIRRGVVLDHSSRREPRCSDLEEERPLRGGDAWSPARRCRSRRRAPPPAPALPAHWD